MSTQISNKKLKAIVFTDIVNFTQLSAKDEQHALELINKQREIVKPIVEKHSGEWLKEIGDGLLFIFDSSLDAVNCSINIQKSLKDIDDFKIRIGIHQGDVFIKDGDVFGDDVNIASRVENFAPEGGIAISDKISKDVSGVKNIKTSFIGHKKLKGVEQETQIRCIVSHDLPKIKSSRFILFVGYFAYVQGFARLFIGVYTALNKNLLNGSDVTNDYIVLNFLLSVAYILLGYNCLSYLKGVSNKAQMYLVYFLLALFFADVLLPFLLGISEGIYYGL
tara:strand:- start:220 stop:1053 length:834 start_codon:yes stop_codon:yes gene_type:complete